jgi:hypothetical protein
MNDAKAVFEMLSIAVWKAVVRLEVPEFPEGCKGVAFREVYQLNARVSGIRHRWLKASRDRLSLINLQNTSQGVKTFNARMKLRSAMITIDWVASLKQMSWISTRTLDDDASVGSTASHGSARL